VKKDPDQYELASVDDEIVIKGIKATKIVEKGFDSCIIYPKIKEEGRHAVSLIKLNGWTMKIGVCTEDAKNLGKDWLGKNDNSWALDVLDGYLGHNNKGKPYAWGVNKNEEVTMILDRKEGTLSYEI